MGGVTNFIKKSLDPLGIFREPEAPPAAEEAKVAPLVNDEQSKNAKARSVQRRYAKAGRAGTVMSGTGKLG